jgi:hypothetical protein
MWSFVFLPEDRSRMRVHLFIFFFTGMILPLDKNMPPIQVQTYPLASDTPLRCFSRHKPQQSKLPHVVSRQNFQVLEISRKAFLLKATENFSLSKYAIYRHVKDISSSVYFKQLKTQQVH